MNNYERDAAIAQQVLEQALPAGVRRTRRLPWRRFYLKT